MITLPCTSCEKILEIDDAFAGGVCRCQYCGTIQTVPAKSKTPTRAGAQAPAAKTLYQKVKPNGAPPDAVPAAAPPPPPLRTRAAQPVAPARANRMPLLIAAGAVAGAVVAALIWLISRSG